MNFTMNNTNNDKSIYPSKKIVLCYMLFGGFIGGLLFSPIMFFADIEEHNMGISHLNIQHIVENILPWFAVFSITGIFWGLIPTLITSIFIVRGRIYLTNFRTYLYLST